jgi:hypothetical protein
VPQLDAVESVSVSHPFSGLPSQSPHPLAHEATTHAPSWQVEVAWASEHAWPHCPQLDAVVSRFVSQPFAALPSQSSQPLAHAATVQAPAAQPAVAFASTHALWHPPQLAGSVAVAISQPSAASPLQLAKPERQAPKLQPPLVHETAPFGNEQARVQLPQCEGSPCRSASQPSDASWLQSPKPPVHAETTQALAWQAVVACGAAQACPHDPQLVAEVARLVSQPFAVWPSQSPKPVAQRCPHCPAAQVATACAAAAHACAQPPQWSGSASRSTHVWAQHDAPAGQSPSSTQPTHRWATASQTSAPPSVRQSASALQPLAHAEPSGRQ